MMHYDRLRGTIAEVHAQALHVFVNDQVLDRPPAMHPLLHKLFELGHPLIAHLFGLGGELPGLKVEPVAANNVDLEAVRPGATCVRGLLDDGVLDVVDIVVHQLSLLPLTVVAQRPGLRQPHVALEPVLGNASIAVRLQLPQFALEDGRACRLRHIALDGLTPVLHGQSNPRHTRDLVPRRVLPISGLCQSGDPRITVFRAIARELQDGGAVGACEADAENEARNALVGGGEDGGLHVLVGHDFDRHAIFAAEVEQATIAGNPHVPSRPLQDVRRLAATPKLPHGALLLAAVHAMHAPPRGLLREQGTGPSSPRDAGCQRAASERLGVHGHVGVVQGLGKTVPGRRVADENRVEEEAGELGVEGLDGVEARGVLLLREPIHEKDADVLTPVVVARVLAQEHGRQCHQLADRDADAPHVQMRPQDEPRILGLVDAELGPLRRAVHRRARQRRIEQRHRGADPDAAVHVDKLQAAVKDHHVLRLEIQMDIALGMKPGNDPDDGPRKSTHIVS
mmetsp:Transcript_125733/g.363740  ORF Transcript_125733/g.363740 Transcript_125733/m.363740 type:complete len:510 (+) Transcript_125733:736-2265(+)